MTQTTDEQDQTRSLNHAARVAIARSTQGLAPSTLITALTDWWLHLASAPGTQTALAERAMKAGSHLGARAIGLNTTLPVPQDSRFRSPLWNAPPYALMRDAFVLTEDWWQDATRNVPGMSPRSEAQLAFAFRQALDAMSPANFAPLNPEVLARARETGGTSLIKGAMNMLDSVLAAGRHKTAALDAFEIGKDLAATPGKVVLRNRLMELIQYSPTTQTVHPEPVLIIPAWIMKYYILDLSAQNSLVRWLVAQGHTVFMISWRNPGPEDAELGMDDYLQLGPRAALDAALAITGAGRAHLAGYCLGGTLLAAMAAAMARAGDDRLASVTLMAAQVDFTEPGELALFTSEAQVALLEDLMADQGYLDGAQMAGAFTMLRSADLYWSRMVRESMLGERDKPTDLMAWNADTTRMPSRMHSEYLRGFFLENRLASGKFVVDGHAISLSDIRVPVMAVGTESDHVAPWRSVWKIHALTKGDVTFILTRGGHNAGIVSEPGHPRRHFRINTTRADQPPGDPESWFAANAPKEGSWWPAWAAWLQERSSPRTAAPAMGGDGFVPLGDAPGSYVFQR